MKKDWEIYRDTGILGGYMPECAKLRQTEDGDVATVFRDTTTCMEEDCITKQREMLIGGRRFCITSVFPAKLWISSLTQQTAFSNKHCSFAICMY